MSGDGQYNLFDSVNYRGGNSTRIYETVDDPTILLKEVTSIWMGSERISDYSQELFWQEVGGDLARLQDERYGTARYVPPTELLWMPNMDGAEKGFIKTAEVIGVPVQEAWDISPEHSLQLDDLIAHSVLMGVRTHNSEREKRWMPDIFNGNFINIVIGTTAENPNPQVYLIDTYPATVRYDYNASQWQSALTWLSAQAQGYFFPRTRQALDVYFASPQLHTTSFSPAQ